MAEAHDSGDSEMSIPNVPSGPAPGVDGAKWAAAFMAAEEGQRIADAETLRDLAPADDIAGDTLCEIADRLERSAGSLPAAAPGGQLPGWDPVTGRPWDVARIRHWADRLEVFAAVSAWLGALADAVEASEPSAATGTPAEATPGGSEHAERQEPAVACPVVGCSGDQCVLCEGAMRLPVGPETDVALAALCADMQREYDATYERMAAERDRLTAEVARLTGALAVSEAERVEVFTEAASYRAAIEQGIDSLRKYGASRSLTDWTCLNAIVLPLAAALGDGE